MPWCLLLFLLLNKFYHQHHQCVVCMQQRGGKDPKAYSDIFMLLLSTHIENSNFKLFADDWQVTFRNLSQSALNFWKPKVKPEEKLARGLRINPSSLLLTSTASKLFIYCWLSCFTGTCFHKPGDSNNAAIPATKEKISRSPSLPWTNSMASVGSVEITRVQNSKELQDLFFHRGKI